MAREQPPLGVRRVLDMPTKALHDSAVRLQFLHFVQRMQVSVKIDLPFDVERHDAEALEQTYNEWQESYSQLTTKKGMLPIKFYYCFLAYKYFRHADFLGLHLSSWNQPNLNTMRRRSKNAYYLLKDQGVEYFANPLAPSFSNLIDCYQKYFDEIIRRVNDHVATASPNIEDVKIPKRELGIVALTANESDIDHDDVQIPEAKSDMDCDDVQVPEAKPDVQAPKAKPDMDHDDVQIPEAKSDMDCDDVQAHEAKPDINDDDLQVLEAKPNMDFNTQVPEPSSLRDKTGSTPLHCAAGEGHLEIVQALVIEFGQNVNAVDDSGRTPLHFAAREGHADIVKILVADLGANGNVMDKFGYTPLHVAVEQGHVSVVGLLTGTLGAGVNATDNTGQTPLHLAAREGYVSIVRLLAGTLGADVNATDNTGQTPLHVAARMGHGNVATALVEAGANIHSTDDSGTTSIHVAAAVGNIDVVRALGPIVWK
ncbi:ankyrin repeat-containing domain protein [Jimgerdemannia flammicorona]|uniref:Ankyrin repeat-containing domain protein n=1 Tax=Jimgerdemannia flammicorona TaxID=994334 RepID=A0A433QP99_9FUNG|nr:ankyrin repeat-containing domain protein [Jimgerdemannia flammicorona]